MLVRVRPRDTAGETRLRIAAEELAELIVVEVRIKEGHRGVKAMVTVRESRLMQLPGG